MLLLQGCSSYTKLGTILPNDNSYYKEQMVGGSSVYRVILPYSPSLYGKIQSTQIPYENNIILNLPNQVYDDNCRLLTWIILPLFYGSCDLQANYEQMNENFRIYIYKSYYYQEFLKNVNVSIKIGNKIYKGFKDFNYSKDAIKILYPITIKEIKENGADLIVDYKNYHKEVPIGYKLMWHRG